VKNRDGAGGWLGPLFPRARRQGEPAAQGTIDRPTRDFALPDLTSRKRSSSLVALSDFRGKKIVVLMFVGVGCPMTWAYSEKVRQLTRDFGNRGVAFLAVHSHFEETSAALRDKHRAHRWTLPVLDDKDRQEVANYFGVVTTPTFVVLDRDGVLRYRGAYEKQGDPNTAYLRPALDALLAGKPVPVKRSSAYG
jgi:peroxiredoxin